MDNPADYPALQVLGYTGPQATAEAWLGIVWRSLQAEDTTLVQRVTDGLLDIQLVADVVTTATKRVLDNPDGYAEHSYRIDDWSEQRKLSNSTQDVYFTAGELRRLGVTRSVAQAEASGWSGSVAYL